MSVTETLRALGSWGMSFKKEMPDDTWKKIDYFAHIAIHVGPKPGALDDSLLASARYAGPLLYISDSSAAQRSIAGKGMAYWLGDPEGKGDIFEDPIEVDGDLDDVIRSLLPASGSVTEGTFYNTGETFGPSTFQFQTPREVIDYICQTVGAAWRVNFDATLDIGLESDLFKVNPKCVVSRKKRLAGNVSGFEDMFLSGLGGMAQTARDVEDYTTDVLLLAQGINGQFVSATASTPEAEIPFVDLHGNKVRLKRIVTESETDSTNAEARAQLQLNRFKSTRDALTLSTSNYDIKGKAQVGDYVWVYDPTMNLVDMDNEVPFRGERINPFKLRLTEISWPIVRRMSVFLRTGEGEWLDLSDFVVPETGETTLVVGGYNRSLSEGGGGAFPVTPPEADTSVPAAVEWDTPWNQSMYQSPITGESRSEVEIKWFRPDNEDGSTITDGAFYEIRFRQSVVPFLDLTLDELDFLEVDDWVTVENPVTLGVEQEWQYARAPFEVLKFRMQDLLPGQPYEAQIRAVDNARPANVGDWSDLIQWQASRDIFPPATPAAPFVASSPAAALIRHNLGRADGGEFNLDRDLHHLKVHADVDPLFAPERENLVGIIPANWGMITGEVPVVASFQITSQLPLYYKVVAVDESGNESLPSAGVVATAELWGDKYIQNLTVDKITAGTISADWILGAYIKTGKSGARVEMSYEGIDGYDPLGQKRLNWDSASGQLRVIGDGGIAVTGGGNIEITNGALIVYNVVGDKIIEIGECADGRHGVQVYKDDGTRVARIGELASDPNEGIEVISDLGQLVRVDTLAFGMESGYVAGTLSTTLSTFNGNTPNCTVLVGNSGRAIVSINSFVLMGGVTGAGSAGFFGSGPGGASVAANNSRVVSITGGQNLGAGRSFLVTGLTPGSWTFSMCYRSTTAGQSAQFIENQISVQPF
jgi:hypothetical protein